MAPKRSGAGRPQQVTDDQIFDALAQAITEDGPTNFTMNKIAARLGVTGPALGYRFGSKHGLLSAFAARQPSATYERLSAVAGSAASPTEAIVDGLAGLVAPETTRAGVANNLALLYIDLTDDDFGVHAAAQAKVIRRFIQTLVAEIGLDEAGQARVTDEIYITWNGVITSWAIDGDGTLDDAIRSRLTRILSRSATA